MSTIAIFLIAWHLLCALSLVFFACVSLHESVQNEQNVCLTCGRVIDGGEPAVCSHCAESLQEVDRVVWVKNVAEPGEWMDKANGPILN